MATGGEVPGQNPNRAGSEDLDQLKCQPCLEDGHLHEAVGMCVDCDNYLCKKCFQGHTLPKPSRNHQLIDKEQMELGQIRAKKKDTCKEQCLEHEDEIIKYYCTKHCLLGCTVCVTLGHTACKDVRYIPHAAKKLESNEEFQQAEKRLKSALETFKIAAAKSDQNYEDIETSCADAVKSIKEFQRKVEEAVKKVAAKLIEEVHAYKAEELMKLEFIRDKGRAVQEELQSALDKSEALEQAGQNCSLYTNMMRMMDKLTALNTQIIEARSGASYKTRQIEFSPNQETLKILAQIDTFGKLIQSVKGGSLQAKQSGSVRGRIVRAKHAPDINVKTGTDTSVCFITGMVVLPEDKRILVDGANDNIKAVSVQNGQVLSQLKLSTQPWDLTAVGSNKLAVTMPEEKKVAIVTVFHGTMKIDRKLSLTERCYGIDYRNENLSVSCHFPHMVQVIDMQGTLLFSISNTILSYPFYLTYGQDDTTLYVSNLTSDNIVCLKLDGTVVATYKDKELEVSEQLVVDSNGDVLVCAKGSQSVHQITKDFKKVQVLLSQADDLKDIYSICFSKNKDRLYVGMSDNDNIKVFNVERE